ncbi:GNAT family N-acetyltransferase [Bacteroides helcogenes]|uniref:GCN5-related N-acetyltransferase n=1 Tax=Bacteroides helcogenes (strain ATCC 35417 / DSM 20613 / JCM 6297 / CCUG 15421 / P 36-108) TaxID=693979 RepID=E6SVE9_BACT6|nr:GNAT family N-acetyltransferase [Bacteroides helcogenes]ADV42459.1 GCN5-related N-acetyltransferase [Bacteroides helcogenes P 36-108]MDY5237783.1 GNAT family N-acetyltransferase [Bacteroides helcogenes]
MEQQHRIQLASAYDIRRLKRKETVKSFDCGDADLNDFILKESALYRQALLAVSYIVESKQDSSVVSAYFSLANDRVSLTDFANKTEFNRFRKHRFVNEKRLKSYPAVKICRLGVSSSMKGMHLGSFLLNFIKSYFVVNNKTGCRFLTVDAYADAIPFYLKNGFILLNDEDADADTRLLYFDLETIVDDEADE